MSLFDGHNFFATGILNRIVFTSSFCEFPCQLFCLNSYVSVAFEFDDAPGGMPEYFLYWVPAPDFLFTLSLLAPDLCRDARTRIFQEFRSRLRIWLVSAVC